MMIYYAWAIALRLLLFWGYHSTDFEVHRNWKAITHNLPLSSWYYESTSEWTLDYPPFFAYFEYILSYLAYYFDPSMLQISSTPYTSEHCIFFMRISVILSETILLYSLYKFSNPLISALVLLNPGLIFVDHIHFQYNGLLIGLSLLSIHSIQNKHFLQGAVYYSILLFFKHIFLYFAPAYLWYYLKYYCYQKKHISIKNLLSVAFTIISVIFIALLPFSQHLEALKSRLFPFGRGLTHSYWAPNFWSLYNFSDLILNILINHQFNTEYTKGLVKISNHSILPNIHPLYTFALLVFGTGLLGFYTFNKAKKNMFCEIFCLSGIGFFLVGWHVHEKAILMISLPMITMWEKYPKSVFLMNFFGTFALFPLIFTSLEQLFVVGYFMLYFGIGLENVDLGLWRFYICLAGPVYFVYMIFNAFIGSETFFPLIAVSIYSAIGILATTTHFLYEITPQKAKII